MTKKDVKKFNATLKNRIEVGEFIQRDGTISDNLYSVAEAVEYLGITADELISCIENVGLNFWLNKNFKESLFDFEDLETLLKDIILPKRERESRATIDIEGVFTGDLFFSFWYTFEQAVMYLGITEDEFTNYVIKSDFEYLTVKDWMFLLFFREDLDTIRNRFVLPPKESVND